MKGINFNKNVNEETVDISKLRKEVKRYEEGLKDISNIPEIVSYGYLHETQYPDAKGWFAVKREDLDHPRKCSGDFVLCYGWHCCFQTPELKQSVKVTSEMVSEYVAEYDRLRQELVSYEVDNEKSPKKR